MDSKAQAQQQPRHPLPTFTTHTQTTAEFDLWAVAVRQQMIATIKRRESSRSNWGRTQQTL
ncbi:hypothetical protein IFO70_23890 [Phormidium tenue FACHB-886]|nr:hypothetical protein [Phormidium tenue FACHB-886]